MKLKRVALWVFVSALAAGTVFAQDAGRLLREYRAQFASASPEIKLLVLSGAGAAGGEGMVPLYLDALAFVLERIELGTIDTKVRQIGLTAAKYIAEAGSRAGADELWRLFEADSEHSTRIGVLAALESIGKDNSAAVERMNRYLRGQLELTRSGSRPELPVVTACIGTLVSLGDPSSFPVLFDAYVLGRTGARALTAEFTAYARSMIEKYQGSLKDGLIGVITTSSPAHKLEALALSLESSRLSEGEKAEAAHAALTSALAYIASGPGDASRLSEIRYRSLAVISELAYVPAAAAAARHFDMVLAEYTRGTGPKSRVLEAVASLGRLGTHDCAVKLTRYLDLINLHTEKGRLYDEQLTLSVIGNLGALGDTVAFDALIFISYLDYPESVRKAAGEALMRLKW